ncbi:MAG: GAF domain-containing protein [Candidatus Rokubacteria bacterium]|nr:GAF domain-containing protein [Candidatus Rokubacteria bacterium]
MKTLLLITADDGLQARLLRVLTPLYSTFTATSDAEALKTLRLVDVDIIVRDLRTATADLADFAATVRELASTALLVTIGREEEATEAADFVLPDGFTTRQLEIVLRQADEKQRLTRELALLKSQVSAAVTDLPSGGGLIEGAALARVLKEFSRMLAAGFDLPRMVEMFLDAVSELLRPTRLALLTLDDDGQVYRVAAHRALAPQIVQSVRLPAGSGLARWLAAQGRPGRLAELTDPETARELGLFQGVVAVPLLTHGDLVAMLVVGQPIVGGGYGRQETEILFDLSTHLATAIRDITLHRQLEREVEFNERILAHMSSGVITIGPDERVGLMNRRAEEILGLAARDVVGHDLRALPSPLGDMLFETLTSGRATAATEIQLALRGLWLEVSTYPVRGDQPGPLGAALVFEDRTAQKELAAQKRQTEEFQLLARVVARIADEIKNPLVSINTFVELIDERYDDADFRKLFSSVVRRDVRRLVQVFEKLAGLVSEGELNFSMVDAHAVVDEVVTAIELSDEGLGKRIEFDVTRETKPVPIRVDAGQLRKALSYLIWYLTHNSNAEAERISISIGRHPEADLPESVRILIGSRTASVPAEKLQRVFDPVQMVQEGLIDVGPAVSQRLIEALGGRLRFRQSRHELSFLVTLPVPAS